MNEIHYRVLARKLIWLLLILVGLGLQETAWAKARRPPPKRAKKLLPKAQGPLRLELEAVDLAASKATVLITGETREPEARLFVLHDDRERHFIAVGARCQPVKTASQPPVDAIRCQLELPRFYLGKGRILGMTVHLRGREVEANAEDVQKKFTAGAALPPAFLPDGGAPMARDGAARD